MKILKALQRRKQENERIVPFERKYQPESYAPTTFPLGDIKIGAPTSSEPEIASNDSPITFTQAETLVFPRVEIDPEIVHQRLISIKAPNSGYCEEYRNLRTHILHESQKRHLKVITITSINPNEGKSITALNLAWLLAQTDGISTLLIDADLRNPSLASYLGIEPDKGLAHVLSGEIKLRESICRLEPSSLHLIAGGAIKSDSSELLSGPKFRDLLQHLKKMFDYILIDAPPLAIFSDAKVSINQSDAAILVVRSGHTKYSTMTRILEGLPREKMLGVVLNDSEDLLQNESYYRSYQKYAEVVDS
ncbi:MAG: polysaccharide biosynthesis tyrosine autokinase [Acidobacteria bacterium]|nr:MAG: polysaccharide biosynthesis tyrosine autokinase [Acidobacteriota bacterium]